PTRRAPWRCRRAGCRRRGRVSVEVVVEAAGRHDAGLRPLAGAGDRRHAADMGLSGLRRASLRSSAGRLVARPAGARLVLHSRGNAGGRDSPAAAPGHTVSAPPFRPPVFASRTLLSLPSLLVALL